MKKLSIITVVYNEYERIRATLENIVELKEKIIFEYIVIDGKSDDGTVEIIKEYGSIIDQFVSDKDRGIYDAMNKGIRLAKGEYVGLLNAGDTYEISAITKAYEIMKADEHDIIYGGLNVFDEEYKLICVRKALPAKKMFFCGPNNLNHPSFFIKKKVYSELGFYSLGFDTAGDFEFTYKAFLHGYTYYNTNNVHTNFFLGGASYKKSPYQKIRIYIQYFRKKPIWSLVSICQKIFIKYPKFMIIKLLPKNIHHKYVNAKHRLSV